MTRVMLRDPIPFEDLKQKLQKLGINLPPTRAEWLQRHAEHAGLVLEEKRFYCRTCKEAG